MADYIPSQSLGGMFAQSLGSGLGEGLKALTEHKLGEVMRQKEVNQGAQFWKSLGLDDQTAFAFASTPKEVQKSLLDRLEGASIGQPQQAQQPSAMGQQGQMGQQQLAQAISQPSQAAGQVTQPQRADQLQQPQQGQITLGANPLERRHRETLAQQKELAQEKISAREQSAINKEVLPYVKATQSQAKAAKENDIRLGRMEELIKTGKLSNPQFASILKTLKHGVFGFGIDLSGLLSKEGQEFEKLTNDFTKTVKDVFGSNVTNMDLDTFLKTIPNLSQTNEGKVAVINNLKLLNKGSELRNKASRELLKKYGSKLPIDFESQVDDLIAPEMEVIAEQFKKGTSGPVAKTQPLLKDIAGGVGDILFGQS